MSSNKFSRFVQPFKCAACGKLTTGPQGVPGAEVCGPCYDVAGIENEHSDTGGKHYGNAPDPDCPLCRKATQ